MKEKNFTWQTLIVTKAANCADTEKMPREKQRKLVVRALARICVWVLEHWNIIERCWELSILAVWVIMIPLRAENISTKFWIEI